MDMKDLLVGLGAAICLYELGFMDVMDLLAGISAAACIYDPKTFLIN